MDQLITSENKEHKDTAGKKINDNPLVYQVVNLLYKGFSDRKVAHILKTKFGFTVSAPSINAFKKNYYTDRLKGMQEFSKTFKAKEKQRMQTYIDESMEQSVLIKTSINGLEKTVAILKNREAFVGKFEYILAGAFGKFMDAYNPDDDKTFMENVSHQEMMDYHRMKEALGHDYDVIVTFLSKYDTINLGKAIAIIESKLLDMRQTLVKIQENIFKSYKGLSMVQELQVIFEKYNGIIVDEFFPKKEEVNKQKYTTVRLKILALFDELMVRYQGVEPTMQKNTIPIDADFEDVKPNENKKVKDIKRAIKKKLGRAKTIKNNENNENKPENTEQSGKQDETVVDDLFGTIDMPKINPRLKADINGAVSDDDTLI